jgi:predicted esterase YcpF (UPF0227 family)
MIPLVYFHGFASGPQGPSPKTDLIRDLGYEVALIATDGDYRPAGYRAAFARLGLDPAAPVVLMGTSLGGFWARRLGQELGRPWLALNPAIQPSSHPAALPGPQYALRHRRRLPLDRGRLRGLMWRKSTSPCARTCRAC